MSLAKRLVLCLASNCRNKLIIIQHDCNEPWSSNGFRFSPCSRHHLIYIQTPPPTLCYVLFNPTFHFPLRSRRTAQLNVTIDSVQSCFKWITSIISFWFHELVRYRRRHELTQMPYCHSFSRGYDSRERPGWRYPSIRFRTISWCSDWKWPSSTVSLPSVSFRCWILQKKKIDWKWVIS